MRVCFREDDTYQENVSDLPWRKSPSRLLLQMIYSHFGMINSSGTAENPIITKRNFHMAMYKFVTTELQHSTDIQIDTVLVWATVGWRQMFRTGLCIPVRLDIIAEPTNTPLSVNPRSNSQSVMHPEFAMYSNVEERSPALLYHDDKFFKLLCSKSRNKDFSLIPVIIGKLVVYYKMQDLLDRHIARKAGPFMDTLDLKAVKARVFEHEITSDHRVRHLWLSDTKAKSALKYIYLNFRWSEVNSANNYDLNIFSNYMNRSRKANHQVKRSQWKMIVGDLDVSCYGLACQQLIQSGRMEPPIYEKVISYCGIVSSCLLTDSDSMLKFPGEYENTLDIVFGQNEVSVKVLCMLLLARFGYNEKIKLAYECKNQGGTEENISQLLGHLCQWILEMRPSLGSIGQIKIDL
jgi:hypothetical protein